MASQREALCSVSVKVLPYFERLVIYRLVIATPRTPDAVSPRQYPPKNALMAPFARSNKAGLNEVSQPCHSLRGFRLGTASAPSLKWSV